MWICLLTFCLFLFSLLFFLLFFNFIFISIFIDVYFYVFFLCEFSYIYIFYIIYSFSSSSSEPCKIKFSSSSSIFFLSSPFWTPSEETAPCGKIKYDRLQQTSFAFVPLTSCPFFFNYTFNLKINVRQAKWPGTRRCCMAAERCPSQQGGIFVPHSRLTRGNGL